MAAKTKCLAANNKRRASAKPTNNQSALGQPPAPVVQTGAASAAIACRKARRGPTSVSPLTVALVARTHLMALTLSR